MPKWGWNKAQSIKTHVYILMQYYHLMKLISFVIIKHGTTKKIDHVAIVQEPKQVLISCSPQPMEKKMWKGRTMLCIWKPTSAFRCLWIQGLQQNTFVWHISINNPIDWYIHGIMLTPSTFFLLTYIYFIFPHFCTTIASNFFFPFKSNFSFQDMWNWCLMPLTSPTRTLKSS